ncbi:hypothetical protein PG996_010653 [Apiospora saccharicola]|uniref:Clr5 domain-containing protein n=1 Tax=Apiospora saccharicola TaxID=335842 RepID=A0ABR1USA1_9PEZI
MASTLAIRCANDPKDYTLWDSHKETLRKLFLADRLSLAEVKTKMESDFNFPVTNVSTYEVILREHFMFRKKLEAGQWLLVGQILDRHRQNGLECVVQLSGMSLDSRLVSKNIRRERREFTRGKLKASTSKELPSYLTITPHTCLEPSHVQREPLSLTGTPETALSLTLVGDAMANGTAALMPSPSPLLSQAQASIDTIGMNGVIIQNIVQTPIARVYEELRKTVPSKQLIQLLCHHLEGSILSLENKSMLVSVLSGLVYMIRNYKPPDSRRPPLKPRIFGINSSIAVLEMACFSLSNRGLVYDDDLFRRPVEKWIAEVADPQLLQQFFGLQQPAVAAMWMDLYRSSVLRNIKAANLLMEVALRLDRGDWLRPEADQSLIRAIATGDEHTASKMMDLWQNKIGHKDPLVLAKAFLRGQYRPWHLSMLSKHDFVASVKLLLRQSNRRNISHHDLDVICGMLAQRCYGYYLEVVDWLLDEGKKVHPAISNWVPPSAGLLPPDWALLCGPSSISTLELEMLIWGRKCRKPMLCSTLVKKFVPIWACVVAAKSGPESLQQFMGALDDQTPEELDRLQQAALIEVIGQGDATTTTLFLDVGVDPEVKLLPRIEWKKSMPGGAPCYMDPLSRAAINCNTHLLGLLLNYGVYAHRHIIDAIVAASYAWMKGASLRPASPFHDNEEKQAETIAFLLDTGVRGRQINLQIGPSGHPCAILCSAFPHDTLRNAIKHGFGLTAIESLVDSGMSIHSEQDEHGNTLLIDALLAAPRDKYQLVHFLLQRGADPLSNGLNLTVLEAALWNTGFPHPCSRDGLLTIGPSTWKLDREELREVALSLFKDLLDLGAPITRDSDRQKPCSRPLLSLLIDAGADLSLIQKVVADGVKVNDQREEHDTTPLLSAALTDQKEVAVWLIEQGADVNPSRAKPSILFPILTCSYKFGTSFVQRLAEKGADIDPPDGGKLVTPLIHALRMGDIDFVIVLLTHGLRLNQPRGLYELNFAVDDAAMFGTLDILKLFVESGGESIYPGVSGFDKTFYEAYWRGYTGILMYLEQHTGWATSAVISSLKAKRNELGRWPWPSIPE